MSQIGLAVKVSDKAFKFSDIDMPASLIEHTTPLALTFVTAHTATHSREIAACIYYRHGIPEVALGKLGNPFRDIIAYRAPFLT